MNQAILALGALRHYLWFLAPDHLQGMASKGLGALAILALLPFVYSYRPSKILAVILAWWGWEELQVVVCTVLYLRNPWPVPPGMGVCSAYVGLDIGAISIAIVAVLLLYTYRDK